MHMDQWYSKAASALAKADSAGGSNGLERCVTAGPPLCRLENLAGEQRVAAAMSQLASASAPEMHVSQCLCESPTLDEAVGMLRTVPRLAPSHKLRVLGTGTDMHSSKGLFANVASGEGSSSLGKEVPATICGVWGCWDRLTVHFFCCCCLFCFKSQFRCAWHCI